MTRIAISVVLLLPKKISDLAIKFSKELNYNPSPKKEPLILSDSFLPHITLTLGTIYTSKFTKAQEAIQKITDTYQPFDLEIESIYTISKSLFTGLEISRTPLLQKLHEDITKVLEPFMVHTNVRLDMFLGNPIDPVVLGWVENYPKRKSLDRYHPHITIGCGKTKYKVDSPIKFRVNKVALARLGNYCSVRNIIQEYTLF